MTPPPLTRILVVEDEADIQAVARLALQALGGFVLEICSSGSEAIEKVPSFASELILLDVMMPGIDGPSTLKALREMPQTAATPVIFMTAKVQPNEITHYKAIGALDVIAKPFNPMTLSATINHIWAQYHGNFT